ncbi:MAG: hypothetical protein LIP09_10675 [Bacteroidales bacterium]|nr:hypothetical protein [Bacteroidales bacterium]
MSSSDSSPKNSDAVAAQHSENKVSLINKNHEEAQSNEVEKLNEVGNQDKGKSNLSKFYEAFSAEYTIFNSEEFMAEWLRTADDELITRIYYLFSAKYSWFKDEKEMRQYLGLPPKIATKNKISSSNSNPDERWINNRLSTGSRPYSRHFGRPLSGDNEFHFKTSVGSDYVIIIKRYYDGGYVDHKYVCGGDQITIKVPDGTYIVYFYSGKGWNPNKSMGKCTGGFVSGESFQKDGPVKMTTTIKGDYSYNNRCEYTLYPVNNGNLNLKSTNQNEIFN